MRLYKKVLSRSKLIPIQIYFERAFWLMLNPFSSWGLPLEIKDVKKEAVIKAIQNKNIVQLNEQLSGFKAVIFGKISSFIYRLLLFSIFSFSTVFLIYKQIFKHHASDIFEIRIIFFAAGLVLLSRVMFFVFMGGLESRYLVEVVPWLESCCVLFLISKVMCVTPANDIHSLNVPRASIT